MAYFGTIVLLHLYSVLYLEISTNDMMQPVHLLNISNKVDIKQTLAINK